MLKIQDFYQLLKENKVTFEGCINNHKYQSWKIHNFACNNLYINVTLNNNERKIKIKVSIYKGKYVCSCLDHVTIFQLQMLFP